MDEDSSDECLGSQVYKTFSDSSGDEAFENYTSSSRSTRKTCLLDTVQKDDFTKELDAKSTAIDKLLLKKQKAEKVDEMEKSLKTIDNTSKQTKVDPVKQPSIILQENYKALKIIETKKADIATGLDYSEDLTIFDKENRFKSFCSCLVIEQISKLTQSEISHIKDSLRENNFKHIHCKNKQKIMIHMCLKLYSTSDDTRILLNLESFITMCCEKMDFNLKYVDLILSNFGFANDIFTSENKFKCGFPCAECSKNYYPEQMVDKLVFIISLMTEHCTNFNKKDQNLLEHWLSFLLLLLKVQNYPNLTTAVHEALNTFVEKVQDQKYTMIKLLEKLQKDCKDLEQSLDVIQKILSNLPLVSDFWEKFGKFASFFFLNKVLGNNIDLSSVYNRNFEPLMSFDSLCSLLKPEKIKQFVDRLKQQNDSDYLCMRLRIFVSLLILCINSLEVTPENLRMVQRLEDYIKRFQGMLRHKGKVSIGELICSITHVYSSLYYKGGELKSSSDASIKYFKNFSQQPAEISQINCSSNDENVIKLSPMSSEDNIS